MALTITKAYASGSALLESHIDNFRTGLHTQFNTTKFDSTQFSGAMALTSAKFTGNQFKATDNSNVAFGTDSDGLLGLDASKNFVFNTAATATEIQFYAGSTFYLEFYTDKLYVPGDIILAGGGTSKTLLEALSIHRKPVIEYSGSASINLQNNSATTDETIIYFPTFVAAITENISTSQKYRKASILVEANGYGTAHAGAAKGGRRVGVSLTANSWYAVYACKIRSGSDYSATTARFVLVFDTTLPTVSEEANLDSYYGTGNWVYMGLIRYGHGVTGSDSGIIKFVYSNKGWCYFYGNDGGTTYGGLTLAQSTADTDDTSTALYTLTSGMSGNVIPSIIGHIQVQVRRARVSEWYVKDSSGDIIWNSGYQTHVTSIAHGAIIELPCMTTGSSEYKFYQLRKGTGVVDKRVVLTGFSDGYMALRRQGHGI